MTNMIKAELYRLTKTKGFYLFWAVALVTYLITIVYKEEGGLSLGAPLISDKSIKMDIRMVQRNFTYFYLFIIPPFSLICSEFTDKTYKNTITSAVSRRDYYIEKSAFCIGYSLVGFVLLNLLFYAANALINGSEYSSSFGDYFKAVMTQLPLMNAISCLFIMLAFLLKKGAAFNSVTIITPILYTTVALTMYGIGTTKKIAESMLKYEISTVILNLPVCTADHYRMKCYIFCAGLSAASLLIGYLVFSKKELD